MNDDMTSLRNFYFSPLGQISHKLIMKKLSARWPDVSGITIMGLGYATPYLNHLATRARRRIDATMPTTQGIIRRSEAAPSQLILSNGDSLHLPDDSVDRLLLIHALERLTDPHETLREIWRILTPEGRIIVVVPNQRSIWRYFDTTPFNWGRTYDRIQIEQLMRNAMLTPENLTTALNTPPLNIPHLIGTAHIVERFGDIIAPGFGGVLIVEARKRIHRPVCEELKAGSWAFATQTGSHVSTPARLSRNTACSPIRLRYCKE